MALLDLVLGERPRPPKLYDVRQDPRAAPTPQEFRSLKAHVIECRADRIEVKQMFSQTRLDRYYDRMERYRDRKLLIAIIALLFATSAPSAARDMLTLFLP